MAIGIDTQAFGPRGQQYLKAVNRTDLERANTHGDYQKVLGGAHLDSFVSSSHLPGAGLLKKGALYAEEGVRAGLHAHQNERHFRDLASTWTGHPPHPGLIHRGLNKAEDVAISQLDRRANERLLRQLDQAYESISWLA